MVSQNYFIVASLITTVAGKLAIAILLYEQGKTRFWTNHFLKNGMTRETAFEEWKRMQNLADNLVNLSFLMLCWRMFEWPALEVVMYHRWTYTCVILFVIILFGTSYWSAMECYSALGDYGTRYFTLCLTIDINLLCFWSRRMVLWRLFCGKGYNRRRLRCSGHLPLF